VPVQNLKTICKNVIRFQALGSTLDSKRMTVNHTIKNLLILSVVNTSAFEYLTFQSEEMKESISVMTRQNSVTSVLRTTVKIRRVYA
jgi:hypothetical protein